MLTRLMARWRRTPRSVKRTALVGIPLGGLGFLAGLAAEAHGFWDNHAFLTNVASSLVCFFFALPVALLVINELQQHLSQAAAEHRARQRASLAGRNMVDTVMAPFSVADPAQVRAELLAIKALHHEMRAQFPAPAPHVLATPGPIPAQHYQNKLIERNRRLEALTGIPVSYHAATTNWTGGIIESWGQCQSAQAIAADCGLQWPERATAITLAGELPRLGRGPQEAFRAVPFTHAPDEAWSRRKAELPEVDRWIDAMVAILDVLPGLRLAPQ
ncbi:hypothetical protein [Streptomyces dysideae]|uniref:Uncharacterized protein n=1 Tax=Streptomyces dysideae TaxID=909626 RepID=A0A101USB9_9ACTN|nr:hypothetical protein [Streptomyces dysideae]KUO15942.1 hypothetical protein AQJ91_38660 [Streptomyces dysideae]